MLGAAAVAVAGDVEALAEAVLEVIEILITLKLQEEIRQVKLH